MPTTINLPSISHSNIKLSGDDATVLTFSFPPGVTCAPGVPCFTSKDPQCYGCRMYNSTFRPAIKAAWDRNLNLYYSNPTVLFDYFRAYIKMVRPDYWRWFVGGDFPDVDFIERADQLAFDAPFTKFMAFTKRYDLIYDFEPWHNFTIVASAWPDYPLPEHVLQHFPIAWLNSPKHPDPRIPEYAVPCHGKCYECFRCWNLKPGQHVIHHAH